MREFVFEMEGSAFTRLRGLRLATSASFRSLVMMDSPIGGFRLVTQRNRV